MTAIQFLKNAGHQQLNALQNAALSAYPKHPKLILYAQTGAGKTLAFLLPVVERLKPTSDHVQVVIIAPSRELAIQIDTVFRSMKTALKSTLCYGGHSMKEESNSLRVTPSVVIGTPGRIADHIDRGNLNLENCSTLIIDEFDKSLELGFEDDIQYILKNATAHSSMILVSATEMKTFPAFVSPSEFHIINALNEHESQPDIQEHLVPYEGEIIESLLYLIHSFGTEKTIVFCNYREVAEDVAHQLIKRGIVTTYYHGGMEQDERERALIKFRNGSVDVLICTDLGSRGLDIPEIKHVVHFQYPNSEEAFIHRKGRTARMSASGHSYLFQGTETQLPIYIQTPESIRKVKAAKNKYQPPTYITLYFSAGKKDKVNKVDIVGFLAQKGGLKKEEIGMITVLDRSSFVAVPRSSVTQLISRIKNEKVKGKRLKIGIAK